ncbi:imidazolonepropionase [Nannocystis bainbridge]|uniref:Imidazolonepropionase n=1 Tax=Nannocystis bainbridge TaxID=2995303 RepID=A0ABT5DWU7_9BACT|nr:imidazolonepropionase [Nannocystis bainbridge]MDC0718035.1 imidazolonepropionase [Nannocystis bainbridge]
MSGDLLLRAAARVYTLADGPKDRPRAGAEMAALGVREGWSVVVRAGTIAWAGPDAELKPERVPAGAVELDCRGRALLPGLVDSHTHLVWGGDRKDELEMRLAGADYEAIFAAGGGILSSVRKTRERDEDTLLAESATRLRRMVRAGTTAVEIKSGYGLDLETELRQLRVARRLAEETGVRVVTTCLAAHALPAELRDRPEGRQEFVRRVGDEVLPAVVAAGLADFCDVFCDRGAFTPEETRQILLRARALGLPIRLHANEFGHTGGALLAAEFGARSADHLLHLDDVERAALRDAGVVATLLPGTSLVLGKGFADGRALVKAGVAVAVATDCNPGSCALESLSTVLALACYGNRLSPAEALTATTHNAAASLGLHGERGRVEVGLAGDLVLLATGDFRDLVYHAGSPLIDAVVHGGRVVGR